MSVVFRVDAGRATGLGHLRRCLILADALRKQNCRSFFAIDSDDAASGDIIASTDYRYVVAGSARYIAQQAHAAFGEPTKVVVLDIVTGERLAKPAECRAELTAYREAVGRTVLIDGSDEMSLRQVVPIDGIDLIVAPYVGEAETDCVGDVRACLGARFYPLPPCWVARARPPITLQGHRVLITAGGSDPVGLSLLMLDAVEAVKDRRLEVRIVIGPYFMNTVQQRIAGVQAQSSHAIEIIHQPSNLVDHMLWCDVALANSGLTKYELAATGTPSMLLSIDLAHAKANRAFDRARTTLDLGLFSDTNPASIARELANLLDDANRRKAMMQQGRSLIDGQGAYRVAEAIILLAQQDSAT